MVVGAAAAVLVGTPADGVPVVAGRGVAVLLSLLDASPELEDVDRDDLVSPNSLRRSSLCTGQAAMTKRRT